ncbi:MAG: DUF2203 family protein [Algisphaera sp.]
MSDACPSNVPSSNIATFEEGMKFFSLAEAQSSLPYVSRVAVDIVELYEQVLEFRHEMEYLDEGSLYDLTKREYETTMDRLGGLVDELHLAGVELRDFESGRIYFPGTHLGRVVSLVWEPGQMEITHWADAQAGGHELMPIAELLAKDAA